MMDENKLIKIPTLVDKLFDDKSFEEVGRFFTTAVAMLSDPSKGAISMSDIKENCETMKLDKCYEIIFAMIADINNKLI